MMTQVDPVEKEFFFSSYYKVLGADVEVREFVSREIFQPHDRMLREDMTVDEILNEMEEFIHAQSELQFTAGCFTVNHFGKNFEHTHINKAGWVFALTFHKDDAFAVGIPFLKMMKDLFPSLEEEEFSQFIVTTTMRVK